MSATSKKSRSSRSRQSKALRGRKPGPVVHQLPKTTEPGETEQLNKDIGAPVQLITPITVVTEARIMKAKLALPVIFGAYIASFAMWQDKVGNVVTGLGLGGWGDLLFHIRAAIFFAEQGGWPRESFFLAGQPVGYAF